MCNILLKDRYKCFTWEHKLGLSCWCMLLVLTGLFQHYSSHMKCSCYDWSHIILKGKMMCCWMSFFTSSNEEHTYTHTYHKIINMTVLNVIFDMWHCLGDDCVVNRQMSLQLKLLKRECKGQAGLCILWLLSEWKKHFAHFVILALKLFSQEALSISDVNFRVYLVFH